MVTIYSAKLTQAGINPQTQATIEWLFKHLSVDWTYDAMGVYTGNILGASGAVELLDQDYPITKHLVVGGNGYYYQLEVTSPHQFQVTTYDNLGNLQDDILSGTLVRVNLAYRDSM